MKRKLAKVKISIPYDWNAAEIAASKGIIPTPYILQSIVEHTEAKDYRGLKRLDIPKYNSGILALSRYRDLCVRALGVQRSTSNIDRRHVA